MRIRLILISSAVAALAVASAFAVLGPEAGTACGQQILSSAGVYESHIINELGPGTALHGVEIAYRRQGPVADRLASEGGALYQPEWTTTEGWMAFDSTGSFSSLRAEKRGLDGTLYQEARVEGGELVIRHLADGSERRISARDPASLTSAEAYKSHLLEATAASFERMGGAAGASARVSEATLEGDPVWVIERTRPVAESFSSSVTGGSAPSPGDMFGDQGPLQYTLPYVADLDLAQEVLRWTVRQSDYFLVKEEVFGIDKEGQEHTLESRERTVFEVITQRSAEAPSWPR